VYGVHLGRANAVVADLDRHSGGRDGVAEFDAMLDYYGSSLDGVPVVETASGGYHLWFSQPPDREPRKGALDGLGVDIKAGNGYVIGPGAVMWDGTHYACVDGWPDLCETFRAKALPPIFPWLVELIEAPAPGHERDSSVGDVSGAARERTGGGGGPWKRLNDLAIAHLDRWVPQLGLYRCQRMRDGFKAVAMWRPSNTGNPQEKRKLNLSITHRGITDFGDGPR
jgi:hypothetical protein